MGVPPNNSLCDPFTRQLHDATSSPGMQGMGKVHGLLKNLQAAKCNRTTLDPKAVQGDTASTTRGRIAEARLSEELGGGNNLSFGQGQRACPLARDKGLVLWPGTKGLSFGQGQRVPAAFLPNPIPVA
jgi:hypothetical protein